MKNLILIEGLPGTGKTTISKWLSDFLIKQGESVILLNEGDERIPCDFYETAGMPRNEFELLCSSNPSEQKLLFEMAIRTKSYVFLRIEKCPSHIAEKIKRWDIGDGSNQAVTAADYIPCALERLQHWVNANAEGTETIIMESGYLQNPINELLFRHATSDEVRRFINAITEVIKPLNPVCIYLQRDTAEQAIEFAKSVKGTGWAERVDGLLKQSGCEDLFQRRFQLEFELLKNIKNVTCHVHGNNWDDAKNVIRNYFVL